MRNSESGHSWNNRGKDVITKRADKSSVQRRESIVPIDKRYFFGIGDLTAGDKIDITLRVGDTDVAAKLSCHGRSNSPDSTFTKIRWDAPLSDLLKKNLKNPSDFKNQDMPLLVFKRVNYTHYIVSVEWDSEFSAGEFLIDNYREKNLQALRHRHRFE